ncbi:hypothetical protein [Owenweeksia hongkongensis]|uniref:hypothetical protein n=1 Tax=Owenweeksia hongkongensis TaxID=253245 RepID=UPI000312BA78|nr:hypothetical protein [Owenweeksia hongkongensis]
MEKSSSGTTLFRTDGLYYRTYRDEDGINTKFFIPYQNGVCFGFWGNSAGLEDLIESINNGDFDRYKDLPYIWGVYNVTGDSLTVEKWLSTGSLKYPSYRYNAKILNDTTLLFDLPLFGKMHFFPLEIKPDSTNAFID